MNQHRGRNDWETPPWLFELLHEEFHFDVDAAAQKHNAKLSAYWSPETDGLRQSWACLRIFCNPPYSGGRKVHWVTKAAEETRPRNGCEVAVLVLPADTESFWWHDIVMEEAHEVRFVRRRIHFLLDGERVSGGRPGFNTAIVVFRAGRRVGPLVTGSIHAPDPRTLWHGRTHRQQGQDVLDGT